ncbi:unnamed protein product [Paramecium primaurelia]|uniref:Uncharacterized protein n=1 Tax=Paramecium primaurelia TaxID=5886 RepID=A0A8S1MRY2_PARPR|nr:unnamed protein product [Paramecium primaurelia]
MEFANMIFGMVTGDYLFELDKRSKGYSINVDKRSNEENLTIAFLESRYSTNFLLDARISYDYLGKYLRESYFLIRKMNSVEIQYRSGCLSLEYERKYFSFRWFKQKTDKKIGNNKISKEEYKKQIAHRKINQEQEELDLQGDLRGVLIIAFISRHLLESYDGSNSQTVEVEVLQSIIQEYRIYNYTKEIRDVC